MAIESRIINGSITEIYAGGGNFITESYPTNFHTFCRQKMLSQGESVDDFREVSEKEKEAIEAKDALWTKPEQSLIVKWNYLANRVVADYGGYNYGTGFFELGTTKDITTEQAMKIVLSAGSWVKVLDNKSPSGLFADLDIRTTFPLKLSGGAQGHSNLESLFFGSAVEEVYLTGSYADSLNRTFQYCTKLRVVNIYTFGSFSSFYEAFNGCKNLEEIMGLKIAASVSFSHSPKLSSATISRLITNAVNTKAITISLHPTAYARVTDEMFAAAVEKNITIAST